MSDFRISCIMPVYNGREFIGEALDSIFAQTRAPFEVVVVDDGSTDDTVEVVRATGHPVTILQQPNRGAPTARNAGIRASSGELITFLDSDDIALPEKLRLQAEAFEGRPDLDICVGHAINFWMDELVEEQESVYKDHRRSRPLPAYVTSGLMIRRELFDRVGLFNEKFRHGDTAEWMLRAREGKAVETLIDDVLFRRRMHEGMITRRRNTDCQDDFMRILKGRLDRQRGRPDGATPD